MYRLLGVFAVLAAVSVIVWSVNSRPTHRELLEALEAGDNPRVEELARELCRAGAGDGKVLLAGAGAALRQERFAAAVEWLEQVPESAPESLQAQVDAGEILLLSLHRLSDAEHKFRDVLRRDPNHVQARQQLAALCGLTGRTREAARHRVRLIQLKRFTPLDLILLGLRETALENTELLPRFLRDAPNDPLTWLAQGHADLRQQRLVSAEAHLKKARAAPEAPAEAHVLLGRVLLESNRPEDIPDWLRDVPENAQNHPDVQTVLGDWARETGQTRACIRCYSVAMQGDPLHQRASYQLGQALKAVGEEAASRVFLDHARRLQELLIAVKQFHAGPSVAPVRKIVQHCEELGLLWEAQAWAQLAAQMAPGQSWSRDALSRVLPKLTSEERVLTSVDPLRVFDVSAFPFPEIPDSRSVAVPLATESSQIRFRDDAQVAGIAFLYETGHDPAFGGRRVFEFAGGGVGVLDYDLDGYPDLHFTQGGTWPPSSGQKHLDCLFQNRADGTFRDVTREATLIESRYSQGVSAGDWNDDGFPDLYIGNVGGTRLFRNNGDGTFSDVTTEAGVAGAHWTTSTLIADLNGDAFPDLYAANYLAGEDLYDRLCRDSAGKPRTCTPHDLEAAPDEFYLNLGDGRFVEQSRDSGLASTTGKGLGLVAGDFDGSGRLSLFVANDTDGNLFFRNVSEGGDCRFEEQGVLSGLAFDYEGRSLASMGVAAGDATGDGRLDLFVTTYYLESNVFFVQQDEGLFLDRAHAAGLRSPSLQMLGFGTQFLDADLDGRLDLVAANGHVDDERRRGIPYRMRPQFYRNVNEGQFVEVTGPALGDWFGRETLGRGLARLDWNRDGLEDFACSHLEHSASLLTNCSDTIGEPLVVRLIGTVSNRDAIGATVRLKTGHRAHVRQITAGDGYQASNERTLTFGLNSSSKTSQLQIRWPSGATQVVEDVRPGAEYWIVEQGGPPTIRPLGEH